MRDFYGHLEVIQDDESGIILQTTVQGHIIQIDPQLISSIIDVPMRAISVNPFSEILDPPSLKHIWTSMMPILRAKSEHTHTSRSVHSFPRTAYSQRLFYTIYGPQLVEVS
jgi:hypothetical protein